MLGEPSIHHMYCTVFFCSFIIYTLLWCVSSICKKKMANDDNDNDHGENYYNDHQANVSILFNGQGDITFLMHKICVQYTHTHSVLTYCIRFCDAVTHSESERRKNFYAFRSI